MSNKPNAMLAKLQAKMEEDHRIKREIALQMSLDAAFFAANEVFQMGPGRVKAFFDAYTKYFREINMLMSEDGKVDDELVYSTEVIDRRLKPIVGPKYFQPWIVRYSR